MNDLSFVCLLNFSELTSSLHVILTLLMGALLFLGYEIVKGVFCEAHLAVSEGVITLWTEQGIEEAFGLLDQANAFEQENQQIEEAFGLVDQDSSWVLDDDPFWGPWTEADRLSLTELVSDLEEVPPLGEILDAHPFKGEADNLNQLTLEELLGGAYPAEDEDIEFWDNPEFWARHI